MEPSSDNEINAADSKTFTFCFLRHIYSWGKSFPARFIIRTGKVRSMGERGAKEKRYPKVFTVCDTDLSNVERARLVNGRLIWYNKLSYLRTISGVMLLSKRIDLEK